MNSTRIILGAAAVMASARFMQAAVMRRRMTDSGSLAVDSTREQFAQHLRAEFDKWARVIRQSGATVD